MKMFAKHIPLLFLGGVELNPAKSGIALSQKKQIYVKDTEGEHEAPL